MMRMGNHSNSSAHFSVPKSLRICFLLESGTCSLNGNNPCTGRAPEGQSDDERGNGSWFVPDTQVLPAAWVRSSATDQ